MTITVTPWDGKKISKPGFYSNVDMKSYHSGRLCAELPSLSSSALRAIFTKSEAHYFDRSPFNPKRAPDDEDSEALLLGRATHHLLLGMPHFSHEFEFEPEKCVDAKGVLQKFSRRFDSARKYIEDRAANGVTVLTVDQGERIKGMAERLGREPLVMAGALSGLSEITMAWPSGGVWLLSRPDVIPTDSGDFTDLKTIGRDIVSYPALVRTIGERAYHQQAALCAEGWQVLTGRKLESFCFYFVESARPHCARMVRLKDSDLLLGMRQNRNAVSRFVTAMNTGHWPGPGGTQEAVMWIDLSDGKRLAIESELRLTGETDKQREAAA
jgi:hypothetical protein